MLFKMTEPKYTAATRCSSARSTSCSSCTPTTSRTAARNAMRGIGSSHADPYSALAGAAAALYGPLHGGANEAVLRMLNEIGSVKNVPAFIKRVKAGEGRLMGFGHRVYKTYDPRAKIIKRMADQVFEVTGKNPLLDIALELERIALEDDYFVTRKLYPNVDFYSGLIYQAMGFPVEMFPVLFAIPRTAGWLAQWEEMLLDPEQKIARPRQIYVGRGQARLRAAGRSGARCARPCRSARARSCARRPRACHGAAAAPRRRPSTARAPTSTCGRSSRSGPRPAGSPGAAADARLHHEAARRARHQDRRAGLRGRDADRRGQDGQPARDHPGAGRPAQGRHRHRRPLRHEAVPRVPRSSAPTTAGRARRS